MCGLVGAFGILGHKEKTAVKLLLHLDVLRGAHSTGVAAITFGKEYDKVSVFKEVGTPDRLYNKYPKEFPDGVYDAHLVDVLIGHNRYATQGEINAENAHPFEFENVVGAHNGTVGPWSLRTLHEADKYGIDSQKIFSQINHNPDPQAVWDVADGAMALSWYDKRDQLMHLARNKDRTLYYAVSEDKYTMFWASEHWMLSTVLPRLGIKHSPITLIPDNTHLSFGSDTYKIEIDKQELKLPEKKAVAPLAYNNNRFWEEDEETLRITEWCEGGNNFVGPGGPLLGYFVGVNVLDGAEIIIPVHKYMGVQDKKMITDKLELDRPFFKYNPRNVYSFNGYDAIAIMRIYHMANMIDTVGRKLRKQKEKEQEQAQPVETVGWQAVDPNGVVLSRKDWHNMYINGETECQICKKRIDRHGAPDVIWIGEDLICGVCKDQPLVKEWLELKDEHLIEH